MIPFVSVLFSLDRDIILYDVFPTTWFLMATDSVARFLFKSVEKIGIVKIRIE